MMRVGAFTVLAVVATSLSSSRAPNRTSSSLDTIFEQYQRHQFDAAAKELAQTTDWDGVVKFVADRIERWPREAGAGFALEAAVLAANAAGRNFRERPFAAARRLVELGCKRLRDSAAPDAFEQRWDLASVALGQGAGPELPIPGAGDWWIDHARGHALKRLPNDEELRFVAAVSDEQVVLAWLPFQGVEVAKPTSDNRARAVDAAKFHMKHVAEQYRSVLGNSALRPEATLRIGVMTLFQQDALHAVSSFEEVSRLSGDTWLQYLAHFFAGRALTMMDRPRDAIAAYRRALEVRPNMPSGKTSLASLLYLQNERNEAAALVESLLDSPAVDGDPWSWYPYGEFRRLDRHVRAMRELIQ